MPLGVNDFLQNFNTPFLSTGANKLFHSVWYTAAILTVLIILLIMVLYPGKPGTPVWVLVKLGIYIFLLSSAVVFVHGCVVRNANTEKLGGAADEEFINRIGGDSHMAFAGESGSIVPRLGGDALPMPQTVNATVGGATSASGGAEDIFAMYGV